MEQNKPIKKNDYQIWGFKKGPYKAFRDVIVFINTLSNLDNKINEKKLNNSLIATEFETLKAAESKKDLINLGY